jgi:hypothetical protein
MNIQNKRWDGFGWLVGMGRFKGREGLLDGFGRTSGGLREFVLMMGMDKNSISLNSKEDRAGDISLDPLLPIVSCIFTALSGHRIPYRDDFMGFGLLL